QHSYSAVGTYSITMVIDHTTCGVDTLVHVVDITNSAVPAVSADVNNNNICPNEDVSFFASYSGAIDTYHWDFGDGDTSDLQYPIHMYADTGTYMVIHSASYTCGNPGKDTLYVTIVDNIVPDASFFIGNNNACPYSSMFFGPFN